MLCNRAVAIDGMTYISIVCRTQMSTPAMNNRWQAGLCMTMPIITAQGMKWIVTRLRPLHAVMAACASSTITSLAMLNKGCIRLGRTCPKRSFTPKTKLHSEEMQRASTERRIRRLPKELSSFKKPGKRRASDRRQKRQLPVLNKQIRRQSPGSYQQIKEAKIT